MFGIFPDYVGKIIEDLNSCWRRMLSPGLLQGIASLFQHPQCTTWSALFLKCCLMNQMSQDNIAMKGKYSNMKVYTIEGAWTKSQPSYHPWILSRFFCRQFCWWGCYVNVLRQTEQLYNFNAQNPNGHYRVLAGKTYCEISQSWESKGPPHPQERRPS